MLTAGFNLRESETYVGRNEKLIAGMAFLYVAAATTATTAMACRRCITARFSVTTAGLKNAGLEPDLSKVQFS